MKSFFKKTTISLKTTLTSLIVLVILFLMVNILYFAYQGNKFASFKLTEKLMYQIFATTVENLNSYFETSTMSLNDLEFTLKENKFDLQNNSDEFLSYLRKILIINPIITGAYYGDEWGDFYMAKRMPDGSISYRLIKRTRDTVNTRWLHANPSFSKDFPNSKLSIEKGYDPRKRPWYKAAQKAKKKVWTDPYIFASDRLLGVSVATPINHGSMKGVIAVDFGLSEINNFIKNLSISKVSSLVMFDKDNKIMAYSSPYNKVNRMYKEIEREDGSQSIDLLSVADVSDNLLSEIYSTYEFSLSDFDNIPYNSLYNNLFVQTILDLYLRIFVYDERLIGEDKEFFAQSGEEYSQEYNSKTFFSTYDFYGENYLFMLNDFNLSDTFQTKLGIVMPEAVVVSYLHYTFQIILFSTIIFVVISLAIVITIINKSISKPILSLSQKISGMVNNFELDPFVNGQTNLTEIRRISGSIESVRHALISFKKYLPKEVVSDLVKSGQEAVVGGEKKEITIFFSDIEGFTKIAEENPSDVLFKKLGIYFNMAEHCITRNKGIIDKFIGDAVMAIWGTPHPISNHAASACLAALEIKQGLIKYNKKLEMEEFPIFKTRIGIHTGMTLVGNLGSENRLNYTCIGDEVNFTSRLEGLNKFYGTQILISNITLQHAKEFIEHRLIDRVVVRGKSQRILIHEIVAKKGELYGNDREFLIKYKEGVKFYYEGHWDEAISSLSVSASIRPEDYVTRMYLDKAKSFVSRKIEEISSEEISLNRRGDR